MRRIYRTTLLAALPLMACSSGIMAEDFQVTLEQPQNGSITLSPALPENGMVSDGTTLTAMVTTDNGYALDSLYTAVPSRFGFSYIESRSPELTFTVEQDVTVNALLLPEETLSGFTFIDNIVYAKPGVKTLKYDIWSPEEASDLPLVIIIHGGGWTSNTEDIMRGMAREIVRTGDYVVASIDYRWTGRGDGDIPGNTMSDLIGDVFGAIAHIQEHATDYGVDPMRIAVTGDSAGGHLSAAAATMGDMIGDNGFGKEPGVYEFMPTYLPAGKTVEDVRTDILGAIKVAAPSYGVFSDQSVDGPKLEHRSEDPAADASWAAAIAPINHIPHASEREIPMYFVRGTADMLIPDSMVQEFVDALEAAGQKTRYDQVEGANHAFFDWKPDETTRNTFTEYGVPYVKAMMAYFDEVFTD